MKHSAEAYSIHDVRMVSRRHPERDPYDDGTEKLDLTEEDEGQRELDGEYTIFGGIELLPESAHPEPLDIETIEGLEEEEPLDEESEDDDDWLDDDMDYDEEEEEDEDDDWLDDDEDDDAA